MSSDAELTLPPSTPTLKHVVVPPVPWSERYGHVLWGAIGIAAFIFSWQLGIWLGIVNPIFTSSPVGVTVSLLQMVQTHDFWSNFGTTMRSLGVGLLTACIVGVVGGMLAGWFRTLGALVEPLIAALYAVPYVAFLPMIILWFGIGNTSRTVIVFWSAIFPLLINCMQGVSEISKDYLRVGRSYCASERLLFLGIALPASLPYILAGFRLAIGRALVGAIVAEFFMSSSGLGYFIDLESNNMQIGPAFAAIIVIAVTGVALVALVRLIEVRFSNWA